MEIRMTKTEIAATAVMLFIVLVFFGLALPYFIYHRLRKGQWPWDAQIDYYDEDWDDWDDW